jgi:hypothetical protein
MKRHPIYLGLAVTGLLIGSLGVAVTAGATPWTGQPHHPTAAPLAAPAPTGPRVHSTYVPVTPCRLADTRVAGGRIANGGARSFVVRATAAASQGGQSGCRFSTRASAVEATITVVGASANGILKAYPSNQSEPKATLLNFGTAFNASATGAVPICTAVACPSGRDLTVRVHGSAVHVVIDVSGYYVQPLYASVSADGHGGGSQVASTSHLSTGNYSVEFAGETGVGNYIFVDDDLTHCVVTATVGRQTQPNVEVPQGYAVAGVFDGLDDLQSVDVETFDKSGTPADLPFYLVLTC